MGNRILVFYGSYRSDRMGVRLAYFLVERLRRRGDNVELIDAKAVDLPMLDRITRNIQRAKLQTSLNGSPGKSAMQTVLCLLRASTIGEFSPG